MPQGDTVPSHPLPLSPSPPQTMTMSPHPPSPSHSPTHPWRTYRIARGETGVLTYEPYKSELLPLWRFRTVEIARRSAEELWARFVGYEAEGDFVGMDVGLSRFGDVPA